MNMHVPVDLGDELERIVARLVREGRYTSRDEVLRAGVVALERVIADEVRDRPDLGDIDEAIREGLADIRAGRVVDADMVFDRLIAKYETMAKQRA